MMCDTTLELYLPGLRLALSGRRDAVERLAPPFDRLLSRAQIGSRPGGRVVLTCAVADEQPVTPPSALSDSTRLDFGFRYWESPIAGARGVDARRGTVSNGYLSAEVVGRDSRLEMTIRSRSTSPGRSPQSVAYLVDVLVDIVFPRFGYYPLAGGAARAPGAGRGPGTQLLLLGAAAPREHLLGELAAFGWSTTSGCPALFLRRGEESARVLSARSTLPEIAPRVALVLEDATECDLRETRVGRGGHRPYIRNLAHHLSSGLRGHDLGLDALARREREEVLRTLLGQTRVIKVTSDGSAEHASRAALIALGVTPARGWDLPAPRQWREPARN